MKFKSIMKQLIALCLAFLSIFSFPISSFASSISKDEQLVNVVVSDTENEIIIAQVPSKNVAEYQEKLKDESFKKEQVVYHINRRRKNASLIRSF